MRTHSNNFLLSFVRSGHQMDQSCSLVQRHINNSCQSAFAVRDPTLASICLLFTSLYMILGISCQAVAYGQLLIANGLSFKHFTIGQWWS